MIKWIVIYLFVNFLVFHILFTRRFRCINHGPKVVELSGLTLNQLWIWNHVRASGLHDLLYIRYKSVTYAMITTMCERWHLETNSFHLPVGEMRITLDDVANLLRILIKGCLLDYEKKVSQEHGVNLMVRLLGVLEVAAVKVCKYEFGAYITYTSLKELYKAHLTVAT